MGVITAAVIAAGGAVAAAKLSSDAQKKATAAQTNALNSQKGVDIPAVQTAAKQADTQKYADQFTLLNQIDPATGQLRDTTNASLNKYATNDNGQNVANGVLNQLFSQNSNPDATNTQFYNTLRTQAQQALDQGGQLSPAQQNEFVRAGLEQASTTGSNPASSATRQGIGNLLASQSTALQQQRQTMAQQLFGFATDLKNNQNAQLTNIGNLGLQTSAANGSKLLNLAQLADSRVPNIGLNGTDVANLSVANTNQANANKIGIGQVNSQSAIANGKIMAGLVGGLTSAASGYAGGGYSSLLGGGSAGTAPGQSGYNPF